MLEAVGEHRGDDFLHAQHKFYLCLYSPTSFLLTNITSPHKSLFQKTIDIFPEMQHVWHLITGAAPEVDKAIK